MSNRMKSLGLAAFCVAAVFLVGCIPEDSLEWSEDGSVGLLRVEDALYLVDGETGELSEIAKENVQAWPDISEDGSLIAYSEQVECDSLSQGLMLLPPGQVKMIRYNARLMGRKILKSGGLIDGKFPDPDEKLLTAEDYGNWVIRDMCENADSKLLEVLGEEYIQKGKEKDISYFQVVVAPRDNLKDKRVIASNIFGSFMIRMSPDNQYVAYIMQTQYGEEDEYSLHVASLRGDIKAMLVDQRVAWGYDWRKDARAIAYFNGDTKNLVGDELALGTLRERVIADRENSLLAEPIELEKKENGSVETHSCTGKTAELVGTIFYPLLTVEYGIDNRILFSSFSLPLPVSKRDEPELSLFCYDPVTAIVADVLPLSVSSRTSQQAFGILMFSLSPDGKHVLLPIEHNRFIVYALGTDSMEIPIPEEEGFGNEELPDLSPSWKGNNEISFFVSENSRFLAKTKESSDNPVRKEVVILNRTNDDSRILSESWPDGIMSDSKDNIK